MLAHNGIVFLEGEFFGLGASVLGRHVEKAGVSGRQELDLDIGGLGHGSDPEKPAQPGKKGKRPARRPVGLGRILRIAKGMSRMGDVLLQKLALPNAPTVKIEWDRQHGAHAGLEPLAEFEQDRMGDRGHIELFGPR